MDLIAVPVVIGIALIAALVCGRAYLRRNRRYPHRRPVKTGDVGQMWKRQLESHRLFSHPHQRAA